MKFGKIRWKNLFSYGKTWTEFRLDTNESINIIGDNGNGKSVLIEAVYFALTGAPFRNCNKGQIVNLHNKKNCLVELTVYAGKHKLLIRRGAKPNVFLIFKDGSNEPLDESSMMVDTQTYLETVLGFTKKNLKHTLIMSTTDYVPFLRLPAADKRLFIEDILSIEIFSVMNKLVKSKLSILKDEIRDTDTEIDKLQYKLNMILEYNRQQKETNDDEVAENYQKIVTERESEDEEIRSLKIRSLATIQKTKDDLAASISNAKTDADTNIGDEKESLRRDIEELKEKARECKQGLSDLKAQGSILSGMIMDTRAAYEEANDEFIVKSNVRQMHRIEYDSDEVKYNANLAKGEEAEYKIKFQIITKKDKLAYYTDTDECSKCEQPIHPKFKKGQLDEIGAEITALQIKHSKVKSELNKVSNFKKRIDKFKADNITPLDERCEILQKQLSDLKSSRLKDEGELAVMEQKEISSKKQMLAFRDSRDKLKADAAARIAGYEDIDSRVVQLKADYGDRIKEAKATVKERVDGVVAAAARRVVAIKKKIDELKGQKRGKLKDEVAPRKELDDTEASKKDLAFEKAVHDMAIKILSDKGIKTYIIKRYIPKLNKLVNQYLDILSASYKISFDEELKEQIALKGYDKLSYNNFSEGERQRCDIALLFAFLDIGKMKNSVTSNLLLMDEVVDRSLDDDGIRGIIDIIDSMKGKGFTIVNISHKHQLADKFDRTYRASKNIFSKLEEL